VRAASGPVLAVAASGEGAQRSERVASSLMHRHAARVALSSRLLSRRALRLDGYRYRGSRLFAPSPFVLVRRSSIKTLSVTLIRKGFFVISQISARYLVSRLSSFEMLYLFLETFVCLLSLFLSRADLSFFSPSMRRLSSSKRTAGAQLRVLRFVRFRCTTHDEDASVSFCPEGTNDAREF